jgi:hypothetical protein
MNPLTDPDPLDDGAELINGDGPTRRLNPSRCAAVPRTSSWNWRKLRAHSRKDE